MLLGALKDMPTGSRAALAAIVLLAGPVAALPISPADALPPACGAYLAAATAAAAATQDDASSGRDAGNAPSGAVPLYATYSWGYVDPPLARDAGDSEDWYSYASLPEVSLVMAEVNATLVTAQLPPHLAETYPDELRFLIEAWEPGAAAPSHVGVPNARGGANVTFETVGGTAWLFRVRYEHADVAAARACAGSDAQAVPDARIPRVVYESAWNYGVYIGCHPFCFASSSAG